jgi:large subunit ribosomal protein L5
MSSSIIQHHYSTIVQYDWITRFPSCQNSFEIPCITKICLNIGFGNTQIEKKDILKIYFLLKLLTNQEPKFTLSKKNNIILKIKKGSIVGCKVTLRKQYMYNFLEKLILFILPNYQPKYNIDNHQNINFQISNNLLFFELQKEYLKFQKTPCIDVSIHTSSKNNQSTNVLLNYFFFN